MHRRALAFASMVLLASAGATPAGGQGRTGGALFAARCADCHGADATGVNGPNLTRLWASGRSDEDVFRTIRSGVPGSVMPASTAPDEEIRAIVAYLKSLGTPVATWESAGGDAARGREVFRSTCASCHRLGAEGGRLGPDLSRIAETRSREEVARSIREASATIAGGFRSVTLVLRDGGRVRGVVRNEDAFSIQLLDTRERLQGYRKAELREVIRDDRSLMPDFGPDRLSQRDLDDLLRLLGSLRAGTAGTEGGRR